MTPETSEWIDLGLLLSNRPDGAASCGAVRIDPAGRMKPAPDIDHLGSSLAAETELENRRKQPWAVVLPPDGDDAALEALAPLLALREAEQDGPVAIRNVPRRRSWEPYAGTLGRWLGNWWGQVHSDETPRYVLIVGDFDTIAVEVEQVLAAQGVFVGRLALEPESLAAYAQKVIRADESRTSGPTTAVMLGVDDPDPDIRTAARSLFQPITVECEHLLRRYELGVVERLVCGPGWDAGRLLEAVAADGARVLCSVTHGLGSAGAAGPGDLGAPVLGDGLVLDSHRVGSGRFLAGGVWFCHACFGAGQVAESGFARFIESATLYEDPGGSLKKIWSEYPTTGRGLVGPTPRAALANPNGPLAFIGFADLEFAGLSDDRDAAAQAGAIRALAEGARIGNATRGIMQRRTAAADRFLRFERATDGLRLANVRNLILLGDPAARMFRAD